MPESSNSPYHPDELLRVPREEAEARIERLIEEGTTIQGQWQAVGADVEYEEYLDAITTWRESCESCMRSLTGNWEYETQLCEAFPFVVDSGMESQRGVLGELLRRLGSIKRQLRDKCEAPGIRGTEPAPGAAKRVDGIIAKRKKRIEKDEATLKRRDISPEKRARVERDRQTAQDDVNRRLAEETLAETKKQTGLLENTARSGQKTVRSVNRASREASSWQRTALWVLGVLAILGIIVALLVRGVG
jgi:hypothetical protein